MAQTLARTPGFNWLQKKSGLPLEQSCASRMPSLKYTYTQMKAQSLLQSSNPKEPSVVSKRHLHLDAKIRCKSAATPPGSVERPPCKSNLGCFLGSDTESSDDESSITREVSRTFASTDCVSHLKQTLLPEECRVSSFAETCSQHSDQEVRKKC
jgi:hypothetical protein